MSPKQAIVLPRTTRHVRPLCACSCDGGNCVFHNVLCNAQRWWFQPAHLVRSVARHRSSEWYAGLSVVSRVPRTRSSYAEVFTALCNAVNLGILIPTAQPSFWLLFTGRQSSLTLLSCFYQPVNHKNPVFYCHLWEIKLFCRGSWHGDNREKESGWNVHAAHPREVESL